jgi:hypothetical protein
VPEPIQSVIQINPPVTDNDPEILFRIFTSSGNEVDWTDTRHQVWINGWQIPPEMKVIVEETTAVEEFRDGMGGIVATHAGETHRMIRAELEVRNWNIEMVPPRGQPALDEMDEDSLEVPHWTMEQVKEELLNRRGHIPGLTPSRLQSLIRDILQITSCPPPSN